jgi:hypothetical protein
MDIFLEFEDCGIFENKVSSMSIVFLSGKGREFDVITDINEVENGKGN